MYLGRIVESADNAALWASPKHPYTRALMDAVPDPSRRRQAAPITGDLPSPQNIPKGCRFHPRCPLVIDKCKTEVPPLETVGPGQRSACWRWRDVQPIAPQRPRVMETVK